MNEGQLQRKKMVANMRDLQNEKGCVGGIPNSHRIASLYERIDMKDGEDNDRRIPAKIHRRAYRYEG